MSNKNETLADLLMGAAFADSRLDGREYEAVKNLLAQVMGVDAIPEEMEARLKAFDPKSFDPAAAAQSLALENDEAKRHLIELVVAVNEADEELDLDEHEYLLQIAKALDLPKEAYSDLTIEILSVEELKAASQDLIVPPPPPTSK